MDRQCIWKYLINPRMVLSFLFGCVFAMTTGCYLPDRIAWTGVVFLLSHELHSKGVISNTASVALVSLALSSMMLSAIAAWHVGSILIFAPLVCICLLPVPKMLRATGICFFALLFYIVSIPTKCTIPVLEWVVSQGYMPWHTMSIYEVVIRQTAWWLSLATVSIVAGVLWQISSTPFLRGKGNARGERE